MHRGRRGLKAKGVFAWRRGSLLGGRSLCLEEEAFAKRRGPLELCLEEGNFAMGGGRGVRVVFA